MAFLIPIKCYVLLWLRCIASAHLPDIPKLQARIDATLQNREQQLQQLQQLQQQSSIVQDLIHSSAHKSFPVKF